MPRPVVLIALLGCASLTYFAPVVVAVSAAVLLATELRRGKSQVQLHSIASVRLQSGLIFWGVTCGGALVADFALEYARFADRVNAASIPFAPVPIPIAAPSLLQNFAVGVSATALLTFVMHGIRNTSGECNERREFLIASAPGTTAIVEIRDKTRITMSVGSHPRSMGVKRHGPVEIEPHVFAYLANILICVGTLVGCWAVGLRSPFLMSVVGACWAGAYACRNAAEGRNGELTCMTTYAIMAAAPCAANAFGLLVLSEVDRDRFFLFAATEQLYFATKLALASAVLPITGFLLVRRMKGARDWVALLPSVGWPVSDRQLLLGWGMLGALGVLYQFVNPLRFINSFQAFVGMLPTMAIFVLARASAHRRVRGAFAIAFAIAFAESLRAFLFSYLRSPIAYPYFALAVGTWFGGGRLSSVLRPGMLPVYVGVCTYVMYYGLLGETREFSPYGLARMGYIADYKKELDARAEPLRQTFASRLSNFNQLSQIGRIVDEDGFYNGGTLTYLTYAFVPRIIWPEKPKIERGSWFAVRIGQGRATEDGWFNNTINMTQAGELYLNFGSAGLWLGLPLYGALLAALWGTAGMHDTRNALGGAWGFYLIFLTLGQFGDLTILVTLLAMYIIFVSITAVRQLLRGTLLPGRSSYR